MLGSKYIPFYQEEKIAIFIDGANLYASAKALDFEIDYKLLLQWIASQSRLIRANYYTALSEDQDYSPLRPLIDWLDYNGYNVIKKRTREFTDENGHKRIKGSMDVELAVDMMEMSEQADHIILFSGDGNFRRLLEGVQRKGTRVTVVSSLKTNPIMISDDLRRQADHFLELNDLANEIDRITEEEQYKYANEA